MTVALQVCGTVGLVFLALLFLFAFLDAHGWFNVRTSPVPYIIKLSTLRAAMNYWGADSLTDLREKVNMNLNRTVEFIDDEVRCSQDMPEWTTEVDRVCLKQGLDESIVREFLKEVGR